MLIRSLWQDWQTIQSAEQGLRAMELAYRSMKAAEKASAERGPTIPVLNDTVPANPAKREKLTKARQASDLAIDEALRELALFKGASQSHATLHLEKTKNQLRLARTEVDRIAELPHAFRTAPGSRVTRLPIDQMFAVIDDALEAVTSLSAEAERAYPELALPLMGARYAAELREYAGRLGSQFTAPLASQSALGANEQRDIPQLIGRIEQLKKLIEVHARTSVVEPRLHAAMEELNNRYFGTGLPFIAQLTEAGLAGKPYGVESAGFVARYVPEMSSIVQLRDTMFTVAREGGATKVAQVKQQILTNTAIGIAILAIELLVFVLIQRWVLKPLLANTQAMSRIMNGDLETPLVQSLRQDEIGNMQQAVAALHDASLRKLGFEQEREQLIHQLKLASEKDFLTNLYNRRAFTEHGNQLLAQARRSEQNIALIILDIDHFKKVNDQYGHATGDATLIQVSSIIRQGARPSDVIARYGGEEFVVLALDCDAEQACVLAERMRLRISQAEFHDSQGQMFHLTSSFGVSSALATLVEKIESMLIVSDRALYVAKSQGRNRVVVQDVEALSEASRALSESILSDSLVHPGPAWKTSALVV